MHAATQPTPTPTPTMEYFVGILMLGVRHYFPVGSRTAASALAKTAAWVHNRRASAEDGSQVHIAYPDQGRQLETTVGLLRLHVLLVQRLRAVGLGPVLAQASTASRVTNEWSSRRRLPPWCGGELRAITRFCRNCTLCRPSQTRRPRRAAPPIRCGACSMRA